jgi:hypothetical protein
VPSDVERVESEESGWVDEMEENAVFDDVWVVVLMVVMM